MKADRTGAIRRFGLIALVSMLASPLLAQERDPYKTKPVGHEQNQQLAASAYQANLKKYAADTNVLVLPGLVADKKKQRVEVMAESTKLGPGAPCEFTVVAEASDHGYETKLIAFAQPSAVHQALMFIGQEPGESMDPDALRFWARGECFVVGIVQSNEPPFRIEKLFIDRRTGKTLPEEGFRFVGSRRVSAPGKPGENVYGADLYQPMAIVSLFNSTYSVLEVPYTAKKADVYQNTSVNPEHPLSEGAIFTLVIEPANKGGGKRARDLALHVKSVKSPDTTNATGPEQLSSLRFQLKEADTVLNTKPGLGSVLEAMGPLDRKQLDYFLTVSFGDEVDLGSIQALTKILAIIDSERGIRIDPPPIGQLHYRAFTPDRDLLDREARMYHPWELALSVKDGAVSGKLLRIDSVYRNGSSKSELEITELSVAGPQDLRKELATEAERTAKTRSLSKLPVIMVFAPASLTYGQLIKFLEPALPTHKAVHVYVDEAMPPVPEKKP